MRTHPKRRDCTHMATLNVITGGLERVICEDCGHVSVRYESMISRDVHRSQFKRKADAIDRAAHLAVSAS